MRSLILHVPCAGVSVSEDGGGMPEDLADEDALMLRQGQLVQVSAAPVDVIYGAITRSLSLS